MNVICISFHLTAPQPEISVLFTGSREMGSHFEGHCFISLPSPDLAEFAVIEWAVGLGSHTSDQHREAAEYRVQVGPIQRINDTHLLRTLVVDPLLFSDEGYYYCLANFSGDFVTSSASYKAAFLDVLGEYIFLLAAQYS